MPTYVYECRDCSAVFEADQRITAEPLNECEVCHKVGTIRRLIQPTAIMFKGQGFHINDYAPKSEPSGEGDSAPKPSGGAETPKSEPAAPVSTPEVKTETPSATPTPA